MLRSFEGCLLFCLHVAFLWQRIFDEILQSVRFSRSDGGRRRAAGDGDYLPTLHIWGFARDERPGCIPERSVVTARADRSS
jgi:hypothetical protein